MTDKTETTTITAPEAAKKIGVEPKVFRRFLRSDASPISAVGQGARYALDPKQLPALKKEFAAWSKAQAEAKAKREAAKAEKAESTPADESPDHDDLDEIEDPEVDAEISEGADEPRTQDAVDAAIAKGSLPKSEATKAAQAKARKAARAAAQPKPEAATA